MVRRPHAHELILGIANDPTFGPIAVFGAGGTAVEVIKDKAIGLPPLDLKLACDLIEQTRIAKLLHGYRDRAPANLDALALALVQLSYLIVDNPGIEELDINPLLADEKGVIALDARIKINPAWVAQKVPNARLAIRPYPSNWEKNATTQTGRRIFLRPVQPADEKAYRDFLSNVTPDDIRSRFFGSKKQFSHEFVARLTQIDYGREMAFLAVDPESDAILGASRLVAEPNYEQAEYAVLVRSALKGQGIGWALMQHLIDYARTERLQTLHGDVLAENGGMLTMCRELGFDTKPSPDDPGVYRVVLNLSLGGGQLSN
jgi:acetyltransferase